MSNSIVFDAAAILQAADQLKGSFAEVSESGYASCSDCGSDLVSETVKLFVDEFKKAVKAEKRYTVHTAESMEKCVKNFNHVEKEHVLQMRQWLEMVM